MEVHAGSTEREAEPLAASASTPALWPDTAAPGGPWVLRSACLQGAGRAAAQPPKNEAAAVAWRARRKPTLQGQVGTGNTISSVVQYPISTRDPLNLAQYQKNHLSAEERRILRVRVKHQMKGHANYPDCVYMVEKMVLKGFAKSPELREAFYANDGFAGQLLRETASAIGSGDRGLSSVQSLPSIGSAAPPDASFTRPAQHGAFCGPQCYCLKFQDAPLYSKTSVPESKWLDSFTLRTKMAAASVVGSLANGGVPKR